VVSVDPSSPAERAGIRQGDVLLAYDGQDVRREIAMNRLLTPGRVVRVRVRVRRDNDVRDVAVKVAPAREVALGHWGPGPFTPGVLMSNSPKRRTPRANPERWPAVVVEPAPSIVIPEPPMPPSPLFAVRFTGLAGARVETLTPGLAEAIGVERGVLVISVAPGVPAQESGLLDGDVIVKANGRDVGTVRDLRLALAAKSDQKSVKLDVARKGKVRQVTLRW
jgi:S1-C subfamily serine protease